MSNNDLAKRNMAGKDSAEYRIVFGTNGWRGKLGQDFVLETLQRATQGVAEYYKRNVKQGSILVGFDPRKGNLDFCKEVASILAGNNVPVRIVVEEPTPTPVLAYLANSNEEIAGVVNLTASHNEYLDDGFKFSPHHGGAADKETTDQISECANQAKDCRKTSYESAISEGLIREIPLTDALQEYVEGYVLPVLKQIGAWATITRYIQSNPDFRLILDPMQGTAVRYLESIFKQIEHEAGRSFVEIIHANNRDPEFTEVNGAPNPTEPNSIQELVRRVAEDRHTLGLATDGDGDRFGIVDFEGKIISANEIIAMLTYFMSKKGLSGIVGKTVATSNFVNAVAEYLNLELNETPVGFKWFVEDAVEKNRQLLIAGEESAHVGVGPFIKS